MAHATKLCARCKQQKPLDDFSRNRARSDGLFLWCRECSAAYGKDYREANRERIDAREHAYREANREAIYGRRRSRRATLRGHFAEVVERSRHVARRGGYMPLTASVEELVATWENSTKSCWFCGSRPKPEHVVHGLLTDHDHATGKFRAFLCTPCNHKEVWAETHADQLREFWGLGR